MQALKKAERAKQNHLHEEEPAKPSQEFDAVLSLAPQEPAAPAPALRTGPEPSLEQYDNPSLSLSPLAEETAQAAPAAAPASAAPPTLNTQPLETRPLDFAAEPAGVAATAASQPAQSGSQAETKRPRQARAAPPAKARPAAARRGAPDASTIRLGILGAIALLILSVFAYIYWQAVNGPGAGSQLPMVPMPPQNMTPAGNAGLIVVAPPADAAAATAPAANAIDAAPAGTPPQFQPQPPQSQTPQAQSAEPAHFQPMQAPPEPVAIVRPGAQPAPAAAVDLRPAVTAAGNGDIRVLRTDRPPQINPSLQDAYAAFNSGDLGAARQHYQAVQRQDPNNRDALLGLAAVALRENQPGQAASHYLRLLELDPNDSEAVSGLIGLRHGDPEQSAMRLKAILQRNPEAAPVLFTLGNLYAQQGRWPEAQQSYFRAWSSNPANADYAFNVAVGLDRLNQPKLAIVYYQRALALASNNPGTFEHAAARRRLHELTAATVAPAPAQPKP
jgi:Tfp pilus assembly protein PilF